MFINIHFLTISFLGKVTFHKGVSFHLWPVIAQSVQRLATGWTFRGSNPVGGEILCTRADRPWGPPNLLYNG